MRKLIIIFAILIINISYNSNAQDLPIIKPKIGESNIFSKKDEMNWQYILEQYFKINNGEISIDLTEKELIMIDSLATGNGTFTIGDGCSWYCGGGPYKVTASSCLPSQGSNNYNAENSQDLNLFTAWVPNKESGAIGSKLNFYFESFSPRVTEIIIECSLKSVVFVIFKANSIFEPELTYC